MIEERLRRLRACRVRGWVVLGLGPVVAFGCIFYVFPFHPELLPVAMPSGIVALLLVGWRGASWVSRGQGGELLLLARLGTVEEKRRRIADAEGSMSTMTWIAVAMVAAEAGDMARAVAFMARTVPNTASTLLRDRLQLAKATGYAHEAALERLLEWHGRPQDGMGEMGRYHAYVLACAVVDTAGAPAARAAERLLADRDAEVRGYGAWIVAGDDDRAARPTASRDDFLLGAALARGANREELASRLERRATAVGASGDEGPYRATA